MIEHNLIYARTTLATVEVSGPTCKERLSFDSTKYTKEEVKNAYDIFVWGGPLIIGSIWHLNDNATKFLPYDQLGKTLDKEKKSLNNFKALKIPQSLEKSREKIIKDFEFYLWKSEVLIQYAKTKDLRTFRNPIDGWDHDKECGFTVDFLEGRINLEDLLSSLKSFCQKHFPSVSGCYSDYEQKIRRYATPIQEAPYLVFIWSNCVNSIYKRFQDSKKVFDQLGIKSETFSCEDSE